MPAALRSRTLPLILALTIFAAALVLDSARTPSRAQFNDQSRVEHRAPTDRERDFLDVLGLYYPMRLRDFVAVAVTDANPDTFALTVYFHQSDREIGQIKVADPETARRIWDRTSALPNPIDRHTGLLRFSDLLAADADALTIVDKHNPGERQDDMDITVHFARVYGSATADFKSSEKLPSNRVYATFSSLRQFVRE